MLDIVRRIERSTGNSERLVIFSGKCIFSLLRERWILFSFFLENFFFVLLLFAPLRWSEWFLCSARARPISVVNFTVKKKLIAFIRNSVLLIRHLCEGSFLIQDVWVCLLIRIFFQLWLFMRCITSLSHRDPWNKVGDVAHTESHNLETSRQSCFKARSCYSTRKLKNTFRGSERLTNTRHSLSRATIATFDSMVRRRLERIERRKWHVRFASQAAQAQRLNGLLASERNVGQLWKWFSNLL